MAVADAAHGLRENDDRDRLLAAVRLRHGRDADDRRLGLMSASDGFDDGGDAAHCRPSLTFTPLPSRAFARQRRAVDALDRRRGRAPLAAPAPRQPKPRTATRMRPRHNRLAHMVMLLLPALSPRLAMAPRFITPNRARYSDGLACGAAEIGLKQRPQFRASLRAFCRTTA